jgi:Uncharacterized Zn ribbon-containing protein
MIRNAIARFMYGRYGNDQLNIFLAVLYLALYILYLLTGWEGLALLSYVLIGYTIFRTLSRNYDRRRGENAKFMKLAGPFLGWCRLRRAMRRDKEHRYFKCPSCGQHLRVPRGKGTITVTCRSCGASFQEKS